MKKLIIFLIALLLLPVNVLAANCYTSDNINYYPGTQEAPTLLRDDVQQCITDGAGDGDTIHLKAGTEDWTTTTTSWTNKNLSIVGAGIDQTNILAAGIAFDITVTTKASFRVSGITFSGTTGGTGVVLLRGNGTDSSTYGWRIDHLRFNYSTQSGVVPILVKGITWGVIDNCYFEGTGYEAIISYGFVNSDDALVPKQYGKKSWELPLNLGTNEAVYIEDCHFLFSTTNLPFINDIWQGGRQVIRYNEINPGIVQAHPARGVYRAGAKYEIYNNVFTGGGYGVPSSLRGGTGVIFNNQVTGYVTNDFEIDNWRTCSTSTAPFDTRCDGGNAYDGNTAGESGWPCVDQVGRGTEGTYGSQPSVPLYGWKNGSESTCVGGGVCDNSVDIVLNADFDLCSSSPPPTLSTHLKTTGDGSPHTGGVLDYVNNGATPKPGYTPYGTYACGRYYHPLRDDIPGCNAVLGTGGTMAMGSGGTINLN